VKRDFVARRQSLAAHPRRHPRDRERRAAGVALKGAFPSLATHRKLAAVLMAMLIFACLAQ
jgi:hypothetical protein